jgi:hypothetical protein
MMMLLIDDQAGPVDAEEGNGREEARCFKSFFGRVGSSLLGGPAGAADVARKDKRSRNWSLDFSINQDDVAKLAICGVKPLAEDMETRLEGRENHF